MPVVGIDARKYFDYGIGTYVQNLVRALGRRSSSLKFRLFLAPADQARIDLPPGWSSVPSPEGKYSFAELFLLGRRVQKNGVRLFHVPHYTLPVGLRIPSVVTVHDLIHLRFPEHFSPVQRVYARVVMRHAVLNGTAIVTDSGFVKEDLLSVFRIPEKKISVIPLGVDERFTPDKNGVASDRFRARFAIPAPFILYAGGTGPHKDVKTLLKAFADVAERKKDLLLVFAGKRPDDDPGVRDILERSTISQRVRILGKLKDRDLIDAYRAAELLVLPSRYEGFGLPPLEAMACGTPCVVSDGGSLPEVVDDAAVVCPAGNAGAFAEAMMTLLDRPDERAMYIRRGFENIRRFSWDDTAEKTMRVYEQLA